MDKEKVISEILKAIESVRYGYVRIIIQNSKVVQVEKTEKTRFGLSKKEVVDNK